MASRSENAKRNTVWGMINRILSLLLPFATRTVIIRVLGGEYLGLNGLFTSILTVLNLTELGIGSAIVYSMYKPLAEDNQDLVCALLNLYKKIYRVIGISMLCVGMLITPFIPKLIKNDIPQNVNIYVLYILFLCNTTISYLLFAYKTSLLHAAQRNDIVSKTSLVMTVILNCSQILFLLKTSNYYWFIILQIVYTILVNVINSLLSKKLYPQYVCRGNVPVSMKEEIKKRVKGLMMIKIAQVSRNALDNIILSAFMGLTTVAIYDNYYYVISAVSSLLLVIMNSISASVGNSVAIESKEKNLEDMRIMNFLFLSISGICASCMIALFQDFIEIWAGRDLVFPFPMMLLFVLYFILMKIGDVQAQYFDAAGLWWHGRMRGFIEAGANLLLNIILGYYMGSLGVLIATIITIVFINFPMSTYYTFKYYYQISPRSYITEQIRTIVMIFISCVPAILIAILIAFKIENVMLEFIVNGVIKAILSVLLYLITYYYLNKGNALAMNSVKWFRRVIHA